MPYTLSTSRAKVYLACHHSRVDRSSWFFDSYLELTDRFQRLCISSQHVCNLEKGNEDLRTKPNSEKGEDLFSISRRFTWGSPGVNLSFLVSICFDLL